MDTKTQTQAQGMTPSAYGINVGNVPSRVMHFLGVIERCGFTVGPTPNSPYRDRVGTILIHWQQIEVAKTAKGNWAKADPTLILIRQPRLGDGVLADAGQFNEAEVARAHDADPKMIKKWLSEGKSYLHARDEDTAWKLLNGLIQRITGEALPWPDYQAALLQRDLQQLDNDVSLSPTEREELRKARRGQGSFRAALDTEFGGQCAVTGLAVRAALRASHILPWSVATDRERLDSNNGLLLSANLDALFNDYLISFDDKGRMLVSGTLKHEDCMRLGLPANLRTPLTVARISYLRQHAEMWGESPLGRSENGLANVKPL